MVQVGAAVGENATTLHLPFLSVDRDGHGTRDDAGLERAILASEHLEASDVGEDWGFASRFAGAVLSGVRLVGLADDAVGLDEVLTVLHDAALAAVVYLVAVH